MYSLFKSPKCDMSWQTFRFPPTRPKMIRRGTPQGGLVWRLLPGVSEDFGALKR